MLAKSPRSVSLMQIFDAVETVEAFALHRAPPNAACRVGRNISSVLGSVASRAETAMRQELKSQTLADIVEQVLQAEKAEGRRKA